MSGGTLLSATLVVTNGLGLVVQSGTLNGVTVDGILDVGNTSYGAILDVTNGLTLNGTALVGNPTNGYFGLIDFAGSQTLSGTGAVVFGNATGGYNVLRESVVGMTLTLGPGITVEGLDGTVGDSGIMGGAANVSVVIEGTVLAEGGNIVLDAQLVNNQGAMGASDRGTLVVAWAWVNSGIVGESTGLVTITGSFIEQGGTLTFDGPGTITGMLDNQGGQIIVQGTNQLILGGGTILGGTVFATNGAAMVVNTLGNALDGVTFNGTLDIGDTFDQAALEVTNGLTLEGTMLVGNPTNTGYGVVNFAGTQTLGGNGTVIFGNGNAGYNALRLTNGGTTLTIGPGIIVSGQNGTVGDASVWGGPGNISVLNQGVITVNTGTIVMDAEPFTNQGMIGATNSGTLFLAGTWGFSGITGENVGEAKISGSFTEQGGTLTFNRPGILFGGLNNQGGQIVVNGTNQLILEGGTILGGRISAVGQASLVVSTTMGTLDSGPAGPETLDGVTFNGTLDIGDTFDQAALEVTNGLTLEGTMLVGNPTNTGYGVVNFAGTQTLGGNGTVIFGNGNAGYNALRLTNGGTTLTIGPGIIVSGQNGTVGDASVWGGPGNISVVNQGTILADGGSIVLDAQLISNQGAMGASGGGTLLVASSCINTGSIDGSGGTVDILGSFDNQAGMQTIADAITISGDFTNGVGQTLVFDAPATITGFLNNQGGQMVVSGTNHLILNGGTILGGTIVTTNGASLIVDGSGALDGVTVDGILDVGNTSYGAILNVTNGLTLNGTALVGNPTNTYFGIMDFAGSQTLSGNGSVVFGNATGGYNVLRESVVGMTLTLGPGITVEGLDGTVGDSGVLGGAANVTVVNEGTVLAEGGNIVLDAQLVNNQGAMGASDGGTLVVAWAWVNSGIVGESTGLVTITGSFVEQGGTLTFDGLGTISGMLNNQGGQIIVQGTNQVTLNGTTILGGTVVMSNGASLVVNTLGNALDGVTVSGTLDVGKSYNGAVLELTNGLTLNGTALVGNPTNDWTGSMNFAGNQSLVGDGNVVFGAQPDGNQMALVYQDTTLTLGSGVVVRGQYGLIGSGFRSIISQGNISCDVAGGTIYLNAQPFIEDGSVLVVNGSTLFSYDDLELDGNATISSQIGAAIKLAGSLLGDTRNADQYTPQGTTEFRSGNHVLEAMSQDRGNVANGYTKNFSYGAILLDSGAFLDLVDESTNSAGPLPECVYANSLIVSPGATLDLNGLHLYARLSLIEGVVTNGNVSEVATGGGALSINSAIGGSISNVGASDAWAFLGRAGEHVTVTVDTGSSNVVSPSLNYASVQLFDPSMNLLAQASNTTPQQIVAILNTTLSVDGIYTVAVSAPANQPTAIGNYLVTVWDITSNSQ